MSKSATNRNLARNLVRLHTEAPEYGSSESQKLMKDANLPVGRDFVDQKPSSPPPGTYAPIPTHELLRPYLLCLMTDSYKFSHYKQYPMRYLDTPTSHGKINPATDRKNMGSYGGYNVSYFEPRKTGQALQMPDATESGMEKTTALGTKSAIVYDECVFFGLQYYLKNYLVGKVIDDDLVTQAKEFAAQHVGPGIFNDADWKAIAGGSSKYGPRYGGRAFDALHGLSEEEYMVAKGMLPILVRAPPEGTCMKVGNMMFSIHNTHPRFYWLPNFLETLLVQVWYPMTVCSQCVYERQWLTMTGGFFNPNSLCDFGFRGVSSVESAGIGDAAYMAAGFTAPDTVVGVETARRFYHEPDGPKKIGEYGTSVPASEHSTMTSWCDMSTTDKDAFAKDERDAFVNMLHEYKNNPIVAIVIDGYNMWHVIRDQLLHVDMLAAMEGFFETALPSGVVAPKLIVLRPDSGDGGLVLPQIAELLTQSFAPLRAPANMAQYPHLHTLAINMQNRTMRAEDDKFTLGYGFAILQGDSVDLPRLPYYLAAIQNAGYNPSEFAFGSGGGMLQKLDRDTLSCAFKCSLMMAPQASQASRDEAPEAMPLKWREIYKRPIDDPDKISKQGFLRLAKIGNEVMTVRQHEDVDEAGNRQYHSFENYLPTVTQPTAGQNLIDTIVFQHGRLLEETRLASIREKVGRALEQRKFTIDSAVYNEFRGEFDAKVQRMAPETLTPAERASKGTNHWTRER